jgi:hypothetical protein
LCCGNYYSRSTPIFRESQFPKYNKPDRTDGSVGAMPPRSVGLYRPLSNPKPDLLCSRGEVTSPLRNVGTFLFCHSRLRSGIQRVGLPLDSCFRRNDIALVPKTEWSAHREVRQPRHVSDFIGLKATQNPTYYESSILYALQDGAASFIFQRRECGLSNDDFQGVKP